MACSKLEARGHVLHKTGLWQGYTGISVNMLKKHRKFRRRAWLDSFGCHTYFQKNRPDTYGQPVSKG